MDALTTIFVLLVLYQTKHFGADFLLQTDYMLKKFSPGWEFFWPLATHAGVHAGITFGIVFMTTGSLALSAHLGAFDFIMHFFMDRIKASPKWLGRYEMLSKTELQNATPAQKKSNSHFWMTLGFDQMVHHLTHYSIIWFVVTHMFSA